MCQDPHFLHLMNGIYLGFFNKYVNAIMVILRHVAHFN
jgi:hypothetical protein